MQSIKCVIVGDSGVGKSYLLSTYIRKMYPKDYIPDFYNSYKTEVSVDNHTVGLDLGDSAGQQGYERLRSLSYNQTDVFIICFSVADLASYENVKLKWLPEVKQHSPHVPILLVGTKSDFRDDQQDLEKLRDRNQTIVTQQQGTELQKQIKAVKYLECSSIKQDGLDELFNEAVRVFLSHSAPRKKPCVVL